MNSQKFLGEFIDLYGYQEFGNLITENCQDRLVESNNHYADTQYIFIMEFAITHLNGIKLKNNNHGSEGPNCKTTCKKK